MFSTIIFNQPLKTYFNIFDEINTIVNTFRSHASIIKWKQKFSMKREFEFKSVT